MKYIAMLGALAVIYLVLVRQSPVAEVKEAVAQTEAAPLTQGSREASAHVATPLKRPFDRTHEVLEQVKTRNGAGEF